MNTPHDPHDPLLQSLADEAADLPTRAAYEARQRNTHRSQQRYRAASAVTILFVCVCSWSLLTSRDPHPAFVAVQSATPEPDPEKPTEPTAPEAPDLPVLSPSPTLASSRPRPSDPRAHSVPTDPSAPMPREFVKVQTEEETMRNPLPLPDGLDKEQQELFKAARGLPLLLVRDSSGKVTRIHVIER